MINEKIDVKIIFFFSPGSSGAPGSFPVSIFFCLVIPKGKKIKRDNHHITK